MVPVMHLQLNFRQTLSIKYFTGSISMQSRHHIALFTSNINSKTATNATNYVTSYAKLHNVICYTFIKQKGAQMSMMETFA